MHATPLFYWFLIPVLAIFCVVAAADPGAPFPLWPDGVPHSQGTGEGHDPALIPYLPAAEKANGAAIVIAPGGGYSHLAVDHEGDQIARWFNDNGVAAFVLLYRHAPVYSHPVPLIDARRAMQLVRSKATDFAIDPARIGMIGFSAGGHLTATTGTQFVAANPAADDPADRVSSRPDFLILGYPVITMTDPYTHVGSRNNLLGKDAKEVIHNALSAEKNVTKETPPTFIVHTTEDQAVPVQNALMFYTALVEHGVPAEMHIYERGHHGLGLAPDDPAMKTWPALCIEWLRTRSIIPK